MVFVSHLAGSYGTLPNPGSGTIGTSRRIVLMLVGTVFVAAACFTVAAFELISTHSEPKSLEQRLSDSFLFKTPTLKSLVGTFMTEQGASKGDISEVNNYFSSKKSARIQMLNDLSSEFDPITDADSNYGRVLSVKGISRTNGFIPEDMDSTAEDKGRIQSLGWKPAHEVVGAAFQPLIDALSPNAAREPETAVHSDDIPKSEVGLSDSEKDAASTFGTNEVYIGKGDGSGQSTKAATEVLWGDKSSVLDPSKGRRAFVLDERKFRQANSKWLSAKPSFWNKAPVQQLFSIPPPFHDQAPRGVQRLPRAGEMGTNKAFLNRRTSKAGTWFEGKGDGTGVST